MHQLDTALRLGRGVIVSPGGAVPPGWRESPRVAVDDAAMRSPAEALEALHERWAARGPVVVEVGVDVEELRAPETEVRPPHALSPGFEFERERLYFLVRSNNYDARHGEPTWGAAVEAQRLGAAPADLADVVLADGRLAWCDGGPRADRLPVPHGHVVVHRVRIEEGSLAADLPGGDASGELAPEQASAVHHGAGPARIIAPAGSGKTRVLTERYRELVRARGWGSRSTAAVAYNVRAKDEMHGRLADLTAGDRSRVRTLHALGYDILRSATGAGTVLDEWQVRERIEPLLQVRRRANTDPYAPYLEALSEVRLGLVAPERVENRRDDVEGFAAMFGQYRERLARDGALDHDEQIYGAVEVLLREPSTRRDFQRQCRHLLVDEFQDLTPAQLLMLRLLGAPAYDVFGVGDDDQVIYGYAGADPEFLIRYEHYHPGASTYDLRVNYRCPPAVVDGARNLLSHNRRRVPKEMLAAREGGDANSLVRRFVPSDEMAGVAFAFVQEQIAAGAAPDEIAVLCRVNAALLPVQILCNQAGVPSWIAVTASALDRAGTRAALAYLRLAVGIADQAPLRGPDLAAAARRPPRSLPPRFVDRLHGGKWTVAELRRAGRQLDDRRVDRYDQFVSHLSDLGAALQRGADTRSLLLSLRDDIGLGAALEDFDRSGKSPDGSHADDLAALIGVAALEPDPRTFEGWLRHHLTAEARRAPREGVALSTIHRVKGMEWPYVAVLGCDEGLMPHLLADDIEEERRIFHVAITRCSERVRLVAQAGRPSRFLAELDEPAPPAWLSDPTRAADSTERSRSELVAALGLAVTIGGVDGTISEMGPDGAVVRSASGDEVVVLYGDRVEVDGHRHRLAAPPRARARKEVASGSPVFESLRVWRAERARRDGVPAYVVLHDAHLEDIVAAMPRGLAQLGRCAGIGPTKLERYGDEILAVLDSVREPP